MEVADRIGRAPGIRLAYLAASPKGFNCQGWRGVHRDDAARTQRALATSGSRNARTPTPLAKAESLLRTT